MTQRIKIGIIGLGRMGKFYFDVMKKANDQWNIAYICDSSAEIRQYASA